MLEPPLFELCDDAGELLRAVEEEVGAGDAGAAVRSLPRASIETLIRERGAWPIRRGGVVQGCFRRDERAEGREDENLTAICLLENLCAKASGALALRSLLEREGLDPGDVEFLIGCGEEACGDRYQRGGGGMAKATGEMLGCRRASGSSMRITCCG